MQKSIQDRWGDLIRDIDIFKFPHHGIQPLAVNRFVYQLINPRVILLPSRERGQIRVFAKRDAGLTGDAVYLNIKDGNVLVSTDGINIWTATEVTPGEYPLGNLVPPRE